MYQLIKDNQMDIMLALSAACATMALMLLITKMLSARRKRILIEMELSATFLLFFDRMAYIYAGDVSKTGYIWVRLSNFFVFFLTAVIVFIFNIYVQDFLREDANVKDTPLGLKVVSIACVVEMFMVVLSQFTGFYYYFDKNNTYHRGSGFLVCYVVPIVCPLIIFYAIIKYRKYFSRFIFTALILYIFVPILMGLLQIYFYGISIVNMAMVVVSISLYFFTYLDINEAAMLAHKYEMQRLQEEKKSIKRLFDQTANAFVKAVEMRDEYSKGHSLRVANVARQIAIKAGKDEEECDKVYYAALLHDVGDIGLPDSIVTRKGELSESEKQIIKKKPEIGGEILSSITEYPFLKEGARYCYERFDGTGYPEGLKGEAIPEVARIILVADAYDSMTSSKRKRGAIPLQKIREEYISNSGTQFDPEYSGIMLELIDSDLTARDEERDHTFEEKLECNAYRSEISAAVPINEEITEITFKCMKKEGAEFSAPSIVLFDSYDGHVHSDPRAIDKYRYFEYGELWFDAHFIATGVKNEEVTLMDRDDGEKPAEDEYKILAVRYSDHMLAKLYHGDKMVNAILALGDKSKLLYLSLTGENCTLTDISLSHTLSGIREEECKRIADEASYIDRMESDIPNVQVDRSLSAYSEGFAVRDGLCVDFHTMSLPTSSLVWHCPYILLYTSDDRLVKGSNYKEYVLIKLNGEATTMDDGITNRFEMRKTPEFVGWDAWKKINKEGFECEIEFAKKGNKVIVKSRTLGLDIDSELTLKDGSKEIYATLTGDQVALTDIRLHM